VFIQASREEPRQVVKSVSTVKHFLIDNHSRKQILFSRSGSFVISVFKSPARGFLVDALTGNNGIQPNPFKRKNQMEQNYVSQLDSWVFAARAFTPSPRTMLLLPLSLHAGLLRPGAVQRIDA
jgi:hypothetical protein